MRPYRHSQQPLVPTQHTPTPAGQYDIFPAFALAPGHIELGYGALARRLASATRVVIDGQVGVLWEHFREYLAQALAELGINAAWHAVEAALRPPDEIERLVAPYLGGADPLFGTRFTGALADFFDPAALRRLQPAADAPLNILYGPGAALAGWEGLLVYVDLPKNEIQYRARAGAARSLGALGPDNAKAMYKRAYFVDWVALNRHLAGLLPHVDVWVDEQRPEAPALMPGASLRAGLDLMSRSAFRPRPWFEPGPWGGQWIKDHVPQLPRDVPNYAWSFELIAPENGLLFESGGRLLEVPFDALMFQAHRAVLGASADRFGHAFPIRFDFLDTFGGGNLSLQCHPRPAYIRQHFGEPFTQDETYYMLDCAPGARVYLGFHAGVDPAEFRAALEHGLESGQPVEVERFVQTHPVRKHDLFLIPNGTIHCSGENALVLEISATPYIFTFKLYDWQRLDLDGRPRPLNIARAFDNLHFARQGQQVPAELIARPRLAASGPGWRCVHLPTHPEHFYDVQRWEFTAEVTVPAEGSVHVLNLVEGRHILVETPNGRRLPINYAETFVVPAAAGRYRLINTGGGEAKVVQAFVKDGQPKPEAG